MRSTIQGLLGCGTCLDLLLTAAARSLRLSVLRSADARELVDSSRSASLLVIDGEAIFDIDFTGVEALTSLVTEMRTSDVEVKLARFHQTVYEALDRGGLIETLGEGSFYVTPEEALPTID